MRQKTKAKQLTAYLLTVCFLALGSTSCTNDENNNDVNLGNGNVSGIITDDQSNPLQGVSVTVNDADISKIGRAHV